MYLLDMGMLPFFAKRIKYELRLFTQVYEVCSCIYLLYQSYTYLSITDLIV